MKLHYYNKPNFGDALSPRLVEFLSGSRVVCAHPRSAELIAAGSVLFTGTSIFLDKRRIFSPYGLLKLVLKALDVFQPTLNIWGAGLLYDADVQSAVQIRHTHVFAVRGRKTLKALQRVGVIKQSEVPGIALGDPGLLYPMLLDDAHPVRPGKWDVGVVPHCLDQKEGYSLAQYLEKKGHLVKFIDVNNPDPLQTVAEIGSCKKIVSSSLHGLIVADAFGISNERAIWSNLGQENADVNFKFEDYYSAWRKEVPNGPSVMPRDIYEELKTNLIRSFPYEK